MKIDLVGAGVLLTICDRDVERERVVVLADPLLGAITQPVDGGSTIDGTSPDTGSTRTLHLEVRRNEVQLRTHADSVPDWDIAVGLDDLQDALEGTLAAE